MTKTTRNQLTDVEIRKAVRPFAKALSDGGNLYLAEMPNTGALKWRVVYKLHGKKATIWIGAYPKLTLRDARKRREAMLAADKADFDDHVARFERRAEQIVDRKADGLLEALQIVRAAFPCGIRFEAWGPGLGGSVH